VIELNAAESVVSKSASRKAFEDACQCPKCQGQLEWGNDTVTCRGCRSAYEISAGVPYFLAERRYWCNVPAETVRRLNEAIEEVGWRQALETTIPPYLRPYIDGFGRDDARFFLPIGPSTRVMDLGSMWGALSFGLAREAGMVFAVDQTLETLQTVAGRAGATGVTNVAACGANATALPFRDGFFDVVILNGVLEWVGVDRPYVVEEQWGRRGAATQRTARDPQAAQVRALKEVHRVLKPGGVAFVAIENRIAYRYLYFPDDHSGLRYTSLMPRWLANWYSHLRLGQGYEAYTYSRAGLARLLGKAGFRKVDFYTALPEYGRPDVILPLESNLLEHFEDRSLRALERQVFERALKAGVGTGIARTAAGFAQRLLRLLGLARHPALVPCFLAFARKEGS
jgi:ubiquinone/menaquinone biosynthesis C-methylase UbiE